MGVFSQAHRWSGFSQGKQKTVFQKQNEKISRGEISGPGTHYLHLDTLGIVNGCVDDLIQNEAYSFMAWNNTYGVVGINETTKHKQLYELHRPDGIVDQTRECQRLDRALRQQQQQDEEGKESIDPYFVEEYCANASEYSSKILVEPYMESGKFGWFDVTHPLADSFPTNYHIGWLNQHWVQKALGTPLNFTWSSIVVGRSFNEHGDMSRGTYLEALAELLDHGVKVHMMYGDRDYACNVGFFPHFLIFSVFTPVSLSFSPPPLLATFAGPRRGLFPERFNEKQADANQCTATQWIGGEAVSLAIPHKYQNEFAAAGYTAMTVSGPEEPPFVPYGLTRQHGNLSFTRVFQAGHMVPSYQPEASLRIFERALFNKDIATGTVDLTATGGWAAAAAAEEEKREIFRTTGTRDTWWKKNEVMPVPAAKCYILNLMTCTDDDLKALREGTAIVKDYVIVGVTDGPGGEEKGEKDGMEETGKGEAEDDMYQGAAEQTVLGDVDEL